jgi:hypothetical protein
LNEDGMVACNPRDREAAHRAEMEGIATEDPQAVTCKKCRALAGTEAQNRRWQRRNGERENENLSVDR